MGGCSVDGPNGPEVEGTTETVGRFYAELATLLPQWQQRLEERPERLPEIEQEVHRQFARGADLIIVGLFSLLLKNRDFEQVAEDSRRRFAYPLQKGRQRTTKVRLLGGLFVWVNSLYCAPKKGLFRRKEPGGPGIHIELAQCGFGKGVSPALESRVARQVALCPSIRTATAELERCGVPLDYKAARRISLECGEGLLQLRLRDLEAWRAGTLPAGDELAGHRVSVQIDGGRTKIRGELRAKGKVAPELDEDGLPVKDTPGRSRPVAKRTYDADWREPKQVIIFIHDEQGMMVKKSRSTIDSTLLGPDAIAELIAMHLHRLGAARALSVTFVADGAPWIWDRIPRIIEQAKLQDVPTFEVLDCCHAVHHVSMALAALNLSKQARLPLYREHRTLLRNGQWRRVVEELSALDPDAASNKALQTELNYLRRHGEAGRLSYVSFRRQGLPIGSGSIESSIRRVINLRVKSNAMFWREASAESLMQIRALVLTERWEERLEELGQYRRSDRRTDWRWEPRPMSVKIEDSPTTAA